MEIGLMLNLMRSLNKGYIFHTSINVCRIGNTLFNIEIHFEVFDEHFNRC